MKISTKGRYSVTALYELALHYGEGALPLKLISQKQGISENYLEQLMGTLRKAGLVKSVRGAQGGYMLARTPDKYSVGEIVRLTEASLSPVACLDTEPIGCDRRADCATLPIWIGLDKVISSYLDSITLQDILDQQRARQVDNYMI